MLGVTQGTVSSWETERVSVPRSQIKALERALAGEDLASSTSPSQDYGEWLRGRRDAAGMTRDELSAAAGVSSLQIYNTETGRTLNPRERTRHALERALREQAPEELVQAVEEDAEIQGVGRMTDFDPHDEDDFPREPGVYVLYDVSDRPVPSARAPTSGTA